VQDISAYTLDDVRSMVEIFRGQIGHYIFASSTVTYAAADILPIRERFPVDRSERQSEYGLNKILCEDYLVAEHRERQFPVTMVPFSMVFGPNNLIPDREQRMFMRFLQGRSVLIPGDGTTLGQVGHVDDQARALRMMMLNPLTFGKRYNLTGADYYSDEGYVDEVSADTGGRTLIQRVAPYIHKWNRSVLFSIDRLRDDIGWAPEYTFASSVDQTYEWFRRAELHETREFDFTQEDALLERLAAS
jgi:nucleoside-diphosphate-sugar epimerase